MLHLKRALAATSVAACCSLSLQGSPAPEERVAERYENLAPSARITATSTFSEHYRAGNVADGKIPAALGNDDAGKAWCAGGNTHERGVKLTFTWPGLRTVSDVVYYGRTSYEWEENWKDYQVFIDGSATPALSGVLKRGHGPQRIRLPEPARATTITLKFLTSYGGSNPGASEIEIYEGRPPDALLGPFTAERPRPPGNHPTNPVGESAELAQALYSGELGFHRLVVVKRGVLTPSHVYTYHQEGLRMGGGLYLVSLAGGRGEMKQLVDASDGIVLDCNLSYDGKTALFSWKKEKNATFQVYRINLDGTDLTRVTDHESNNLNPCWLPGGDVAFLSDRKPAFAYCWTTTTPILYRCDPDGGNQQRLSGNYLNDFTPSVMEDGRILYSRWEYVDRPAIPIQSLWTVNQDGTGLAGFFGNRVLSPATFMEAHQIPGTGKVLTVLTSHNGPCRGAIGVIDPSAGANAQEAIRNVTPEVDIGRVDRGDGNNVRGPYEGPYPIDDTHFLVSRAGTVLVRDYEGTGQATLLEREGPLGYYTPRPVMARQVPRVQPATIPEETKGEAWATLIVQDVYHGLEPHVRRGAIERIAVVQELEKSKFAHVGKRAFGFQFPVVSCGATYAPKKVWGYAKVEEDGSAHFRVPPGLPIYFMALDGEGRALQRMRTFTHLMPGERQSCVGCHADRNYAAPRPVTRPMAALRPPQDLDPPEWGVRGFSYAHIVQPVLDRHCVTCHDAVHPLGGVDLAGDKTDFFNVSYETLARQGSPGQNPYTRWIPTYNGQEANILHVRPGFWGSPASKLADLVLAGHPDEDGKPRVHVDEADRHRVFAWIDLNVPYYGTSASRHNDLKGCRQMLPTDLDNVLADISRRRCVPCHEENGVPRDAYLRITNVKHNGFLLAPLAREAGGTEACGQAVFASEDDPDYQALLGTFDDLHRLVARTPRMDMVGPGEDRRAWTDRERSPQAGR